ncbi:hypothetical protein [Fischerella thermalis]|uniref:hypothetical protein n=1 Tax=Fischerella thermalis TaxID=372787 RepID=UPI00307D9B83
MHTDRFSSVFIGVHRCSLPTPSLLRSPFTDSRRNKLILSNTDRFSSVFIGVHRCSSVYASHTIIVAIAIY